MSSLFDIRNNYFIGNFTTCINKAHMFESDDPAQADESAFYMYLSYLEQKKFNIIFNEIDESRSQSLQMVKKLAEYLKSDNSRVKKEIVSKVDLQTDALVKDELASLAASAIYSQDGNFDKALQVLHPFDSLTCWAARIQLYILIHRLDLAAQLLELMQDKEEESTLTFLAMCWYFISVGGDKLREIVPIVQDLILRNSASTPLLLNLQVTALIAQGNQEQARQLANEAYEKDSNNPEILSNMIILAQRNDIKNRCQNQLNDIEPCFLAYLNEKESEFDNLIASEDFIGE